MTTARLNHRLLSLVLTASLGSFMPVMAADFEDSVPMELFRALMSNPITQNELRVFSSLPPRFPNIPIPAGFSVLGSIDQGFSQRVILQTSLGEEPALAAVSESALLAGFVDLQMMNGFGTGFVSPGRMAPKTLCRDDVGFLTIVYMAGSGLNQVSLGVSNASLAGTNDSCSAVSNQRAGLPGRPGTVSALDGLTKYMPVMQLPDASPQARAPRLGMSASGGSNGTYEVRTQFSSDQRLPELFEFFADQIESQGWAIDSEATGKISASGNWIRIPDSDTYLHGNFTIVQSSESNFSMAFRMTKLSVN